MWILSIMFVLVFLSILLGYLLFRLMVVRSKKPYPRPDPEKADDETTRAGIRFILQEYDRIQQWGYETIQIASHKGETLCGYFVAAKEPTKHTVLMIHGYRSCNFYEFAHFALMYLEHFGWNVLIVDNYAHESSAGRYIGFGWMDRLDIAAWSNWLVDRFAGQGKILLHGCSMGAAAVLTAAGEEPLPAQVGGIVADCGFAALKNMCRNIARTYLHIPLFPVYHIASCFCKLHAGYFFRQAQARKSVQKIHIPVLIIHGEEDRITPCENARILYDALHGPKRLFLVPGAGHGQSILYDRAGYEKNVQALFEQIMQG